MNQLVEDKSLFLAGATVVEPAPAFRVADRRIFLADRNLGSLDVLKLGPPLPDSLPMASSQVGNLFADRNDANLHWYLPDYAPADDIDPDFAFSATQKGQDSSGNPFNTAALTLRLRRFQPDDVAKFAAANPGATLKEIPLGNLSAILASFYTDDNGQQQQRTFSGAVQDVGGDFFTVTFDGTILGAAVIGVYQDLTTFGKALISLSANYQAWAVPVTTFINTGLRLQLSQVALVQPAAADGAPAADPGGNAAVATAPPQFLVGLRSSPVLDFQRIHSFGPQLVDQNVGNKQDPAALQEVRESWQKQLPLGLKYKADGYQLKFTVSTAAVASHLIRDVSDLKDFSKSQTEFAELKAIPNVADRYPSIDRLYIGVLSRRIVVVPQRYSIVRNHIGCAALCMALVDSSAANGSKCKFEFDFTVAPEISRVEMQKLAAEIAGMPEFKGYTLTLPQFLRDDLASTVANTTFATAHFAPGTDPHTFAVTLSIQDPDAQTPAVANANVIIAYLRVGSGLGGTLSLKLDDGYPDPIPVRLELDFAHTTGTDELDVTLDETAGQIDIVNRMPLDLMLSGYALTKGLVVTEVKGDLPIPANGSTAVPLPADHTGLLLSADAQLALPQPMTTSVVSKYLNFQTVDVQETQYAVSVTAAGVNFNIVDSIQAAITFASLPNVAVRTLRLDKNLHADSTHIIIPLENAVFTLPGTVTLTVHFIDPGTSDVTFSIDNDFTAEPALILLQTQIDAAKPK